MRERTRRLLGPALVCALALPGCSDDAPPPLPPAARDAGARVPAPARPHAGARSGYVAVIAARDSADVATELGGRIAAVHVELGDRVEPGQLIATIDDRIAREELAVAAAAQRAAEAARDSARVEVEETRTRLETERALAAQGTTAKAELDRAAFAHDKARAAYQRAEADLSEQAARVSQLRARVTSTRILAPYAGTVSMRYLDPGATISPGTAIIRLIASDELWVKFAVPSEDGHLIRVGEPVTVHVETSGIVVNAIVRHVAPELEPASQMIIAEAELAIDDAQRAQIKAGQAARVRRPKR